MKWICWKLLLKKALSLEGNIRLLQVVIITDRKKINQSLGIRRIRERIKKAPLKLVLSRTEGYWQFFIDQGVGKTNKWIFSVGNTTSTFENYIRWVPEAVIRSNRNDSLGNRFLRRHPGELFCLNMCVFCFVFCSHTRISFFQSNINWVDYDHFWPIFE